jgi:proteasome activator subunit 4
MIRLCISTELTTDPGWHEEQLPDCPTPRHRRLTTDMRRELVKFLRTPALLAMFSQDSSTVANIQSCLKSMSVMEPDLILYPILERAFPALEAVVEVKAIPFLLWPGY